jgi:hypothetical protein
MTKLMPWYGVHPCLVCKLIARRHNQHCMCTSRFCCVTHINCVRLQELAPLAVLLAAKPQQLILHCLGKLQVTSCYCGLQLR